MLKYMPSTNNVWPASQSYQPVHCNIDVITPSRSSSAASGLCLQQETARACSLPSSFSYSRAPTAQHLYQHSASYPRYAGYFWFPCITLLEANTVSCLHNFIN